jgi:hypothetical protein
MFFIMLLEAQASIRVDNSILLFVPLVGNCAARAFHP